MQNTDPLHGQRLLVDWGHNFYNVEARLADDEQLIRARICGLLAQSRRAVEEAESAHRRGQLPALTRESSRHDPAALETARALERLAARIGGIAGRLLAQPAPPQLQLARARRRDPRSLARLLACDAELASRTETLWRAIEHHNADQLTGRAVELTVLLDDVNARISGRGDALAL